MQARDPTVHQLLLGAGVGSTRAGAGAWGAAGTSASASASAVWEALQTPSAAQRGASSTASRLEPALPASPARGQPPRYGQRRRRMRRGIRRNLSNDPQVFELAVHAVCRVMAARVESFEARALALSVQGLGAMGVRCGAGMHAWRDAEGEQEGERERGCNG